MGETAEGYLVCRDVPIARTGTQIYWENEVPPLQGDAGGRVHVERSAEEVFAPDSIASYEGKPLVDDHPFEAVGPDNWSDLTIGYIANVRRGEGIHDELLLGDLIFTTRRGIDRVKRGKRALSVGYNAKYEQDEPGQGRQREIFCNHVALVDEGRCGARCTIMDGRAVYDYDGTDDAGAFVEGEHPRVPKGGAGGGEFTSGGGGGASAGKQRTMAPAVRKGGKLTTASGGALPEHIAKLKIPPAWTEVHYNPDPDGDLLVSGRDGLRSEKYPRGRPTSIYADSHHAEAAAAKFARVKELAAKFNEVKQQNEAARRDPTRREAADAAALIMATGMRPGSERDTGAAAQGYGATTLEARHVISTKAGVKLRFVPGKKHGQTIEMPVEDPAVAKMLLKRKQARGPRDKLFDADYGTLLKHVHSLGGGEFKTKDLRTHVGTQTAIDVISKLPEPRDEKEYKRAVKHVATAVSDKLGNTPAIALQSYINPSVFAAWHRAGMGETSDALNGLIIRWAWALDDLGDEPEDDELPDAHWGSAEAELPDWRTVLADEDDADDDELLDETPPDVIAMLGFDPLDFADEPPDDEANIDYPDEEANIDYADDALT